MEYHIKLKDGSTIASFKYEFDRNCCIDALQDFYSDDTFDAVDEEE